jgi:hypothetical protein
MLIGTCDNCGEHDKPLNIYEDVLGFCGDCEKEVFKDLTLLLAPGLLVI